MTYQLVSIDIENESGSKKLGKLEIRAESKSDIINPIFKDNGIFYKNVEKVKELDDETPIQFFIKEDIENISSMVLLEETYYKLNFLPKSSISKIKVLPSLVSQQNFVLEHSDDEYNPYRASLNFRSYAGKSFFDFEVNGIKSKKYPFEVRSKKIGYYKQYDAMIADLAEVASGMIFEQNAPLLQRFDFGHDKKETLYEEFMFLEYLFREENLPFVYEFIKQNPHSKLEKYSENVPTAFAHNIGPSELIDIVSKAENLSKAEQIPHSWPAEMKEHILDSINHDFFEDTLDTPENRLLKYFLESVDKLIYDLISRADEGNIKDKLQIFLKKIQNYLSDRWLMDIGPLKYIPMNSQIMQKKEGYREIFKYYIYFEFAFRLKWEDIEDTLEGYERKLSELYEYWCYIKLLNVLSELSNKTLKFEEVYKVNLNDWSISLKKGISNAQEFNWIYNDKPIKIRAVYGGRFSKKSRFNAFSIPLKPDYTLIIKYGHKERLLHFDAKYKFKKKILNYFKTLNSFDLENKDDEEIYREYKTEDICKMHTYKDAISNSLGAYVLYPGDLSEIFEEIENKCIPSVGAFPLTPGKSEDNEEKIEDFLNDALSQIKD
ncbi:DUF2357 domain-containing protein [Methanobacterium alcaliphilum]|uniref:DUF2357 domain-containing protein n=1 Tax=Methanobacterium alcaliphilum TaxID=392018 RepID=UPI002009EF0F|nr:DUF2357 domain-containing protein [Methanobacterium alcaliphilum]MCK9151814.1 DUF2357 domain-containing protein [Methanobacterium alcaliphilum]